MLLLYTGGVLFGYFLLVPYVIGFFSAFVRADIPPFWSIGAYIQIHLSMVLLCGLIFFSPWRSSPG
jgi:Sec-independent protein secretion pathway component TatC